MIKFNGGRGHKRKEGKKKECTDLAEIAESLRGGLERKRERKSERPFHRRSSQQIPMNKIEERRVARSQWEKVNG